MHGTANKGFAGDAQGTPSDAPPPYPQQQYAAAPESQPGECPPSYESTLYPPSAAAPSQVVVQPMLVTRYGQCPQCQSYGHWEERYDACALACVITMTILWIPFSFFGLLCLLTLRLAKSGRCGNCGYSAFRGNAKAVYVLFGISLVMQVALYGFVIWYYNRNYRSISSRNSRYG